MGKTELGIVLLLVSLILLPSGLLMNSKKPREPNDWPPKSQKYAQIVGGIIFIIWGILVLLFL